MPKVTHVAKAMKDAGTCCKCRAAIKAGEPYKWFANLIGRTSIKKKFCANCRVRSSDLTTSDKLSRLYAAQESIEDILTGDDFTALKAVAPDALQCAANEAREVGQEYQESFDNMPDGLQQGDTGQRIEEMANNCESWADELESAINEVDGIEVDEEAENGVEAAVQEVMDAAQAASGSLEVA